MSKIVIIDACYECPHRFAVGLQSRLVCDKTNKVVLNDETIPEWCPLQDAKDYVIKEK